MDVLLTTPYLPLSDDDVISAPFAGRQKVFERLYGQLTDPVQNNASIILGQREVGKTAILRHFGDYFDESFVGAYLALKNVPLNSEADWLRLLAETATAALAARNLSLHRVTELVYDPADPRGWFADTYLPEYFAAIRRHRRLVFLLDDAGALVNAVNAGQLPADTFAYLKKLLAQYPALGFVLAVDSRYEADLPVMRSLIDLTDIFRLDHLSLEETTWLLRAPVEGVYRLTDEAVAAVHRAAGGHPRLLQRFGFHLFQRWEASPQRTTLTVEDVKPVSALVYNQSEADFQRAWGAMSRNERLALTGISSLLYADPLASLNTAAVQSWLVESDYPLDMTAIHAALRGLEYHEIVENGPGGIRVTAGLMQTWLLEHARLTTTPDEDTTPATPRWLLLAALALLVILAILLAMVASSGGSASPAGDAPLPTVTLFQ